MPIAIENTILRTNTFKKQKMRTFLPFSQICCLQAGAPTKALPGPYRGLPGPTGAYRGLPGPYRGPTGALPGTTGAPRKTRQHRTSIQLHENATKTHNLKQNIILREIVIFCTNLREIVIFCTNSKQYNTKHISEHAYTRIIAIPSLNGLCEFETHNLKQNIILREIVIFCTNLREIVIFCTNSKQYNTKHISEHAYTRIALCSLQHVFTPGFSPAQHLPAGRPRFCLASAFFFTYPRTKVPPRIQVQQR